MKSICQENVCDIIGLNWAKISPNVFVTFNGLKACKPIKIQKWLQLSSLRFFYGGRYFGIKSVFVFKGRRKRGFWKAHRVNMKWSNERIAAPVENGSPLNISPKVNVSEIVNEWDGLPPPWLPGPAANNHDKKRTLLMDPCIENFLLMDPSCPMRFWVRQFKVYQWPRSLSGPSSNPSHFGVHQSTHSAPLTETLTLLITTDVTLPNPRAQPCSYLVRGWERAQAWIWVRAESLSYTGQ